VYVYYTPEPGSNVNRLSRFTVSESNPNVADPASEVVLLDGLIPDTIAHHGGASHFGADGMLYLRPAT
jgi:hypothetical protein